jgi:hypothetical protein
MRSRDMDDIGILRLAPGLQCLPRAEGAILLTRTGRYLRIGRATWCFVECLAREPDGLTVLRATQAFPRVDLESLMSRGVVDYQPPFGGAPGVRLTGELWRRNLRWRARLRRHGWRALAPLVATAAGGAAEVPFCRPTDLDRVEHAARLSLALPGTSAQCTVVSAAIHDCLKGLGFPARIVLLGSADQFMFHARAYVGQHPVDPAATLVDLEPLKPLS